MRMISISSLKLALVTIVLASSISAQVIFEDLGRPTLKLPEATPENVQRKLDVLWTKGPDPTPVPTAYPTKYPTKKPTRKPTPSPTVPAPINTNVPTEILPPKCGTIVGKLGMLLGPIDETNNSKDKFGCNAHRHGNYYYRQMYFPSYMYGFKLTKRCDFLVRTPENNRQYAKRRGVMEWFEQAAKNLKRVDNSGYKVSDDDIILSGWTVPAESDVIRYNIAECPETWCVKIKGSAVTRRSLQIVNNPNPSNNTDPPELLYAFSHRSAWNDFYWLWRGSIRHSRRNWVYKNNHFLKCGCESFCLDESNPWDSVDIKATCYVEELCGQRTYQIAYASDYPQNLRASWESTGTTQIMEWFNECARARYSCTEIPSSDMSMYQGTRWGHWRYKGYPRVFRYENYQNQPFVYGLGGDRYYGFPTSNTNSQPHIAWTCPTIDHRNQLDDFGQYVAATEFMRDSGIGETVPTVPCTEEYLPEPDPPNTPPPVGPDCSSINNKVYCYQTPGATCYARETNALCNNVTFHLADGTTTYVYDDVALWHDDCLSSLGCNRVPGWASIDGNLTYAGHPNAYAHYGNIVGWELLLFNRGGFKGQDVIVGKNKIMYYDCATWESAYSGKNFTDGAGDRYWWRNNWPLDNTYGDLYWRRPCTSAPSETPSLSPTISTQPSDVPSLEPTVCTESYLTSENLNIALAIDLSYSMYEKEFSATDPVGDLNGDGKNNTILDAQIAAIQDLLINIGESPQLDNNNCEIQLISYGTDATNHGIWAPLSNSNDNFNPALMQYIKDQLWAPTSGQEVFNTNNGFTNFDAALDVAVDYFTNDATAGRKNLLVFLSDGEPNVRGDGDDEGYCSETTVFWNGNGTVLQCSDLNLTPGAPHTFCRGNDPNCAANEEYQDCVRGPNECMNADAVTQYDSEIQALVDLNVERLAIGVGNESNVAWGSALWIIDNNPAKYLGVLPLQALTLEELSEYLSALCILNTDPPTKSPSEAPSGFPTVSVAPSLTPSSAPSDPPSVSFNPTPSETLSMLPSISPSESMLPSLSSQPTYACPAEYEDNGPAPYGEMKMCVRTSLGYNGVANDTLSLQEQIGAGFKEVNFIESLITIRYDLSAGFCVLSFNVEPKERLETTANGGAFGVIAYLCDLSQNQTRTNPYRVLPAEINATYYAELTDESNATYFNQGALITVCIAPDDESYEDDILMSGISYFNWKRNDLNETAGNSTSDGTPDTVAGDYLYYSSNPQIYQEAITSGYPSGNGLTSFINADCFHAEYCHFSSVLFADFYLSRGVVFGEGSARLMFRNMSLPVYTPSRGRTRNLEESTALALPRELQMQDDVADSEFNVAVPVSIDGDGVGGRGTAGGSSLGLTILFSSSIALLSALLLLA